MRRWMARSLLLVLAVASGVAFNRHCPGCIDRSRVNKECEWTGDSAFPIDWKNPAHRQHLTADAQLAEDLAIRRGDAEFNRLYGYEAHGGLIEHGRVVRECMARLVDAIERNHAVTPEQIAAARGQRSLLFDVTAALSFVPLYLFGAIVACSRLHRRFSTERRSVRVAAIVATSVVATFLALQVGQLWLSVWEGVRIRNGHMSGFRAVTYTRWPYRHGIAVYAAGVATFWLVALCWRRTAFRNLTRSAAMFAATLLAAMFADVFVQHAAGYALVAAALAIFLHFISTDRFATDTTALQGVLLR